MNKPTCYLCGKTQTETGFLGAFIEWDGWTRLSPTLEVLHYGFTYLCREHGFSFIDCFSGLPFGHDRPMKPPSLRGITRVYPETQSHHGY